MSYKGSDLSPAFKSFYKKEIKRITKILTDKGCTNIQFNYGFYFFSGFFTTATNQIYYINSGDTRDGYRKLLYRTAKDYKDYSGGFNRWINPEDLKDIELN
jgi:hypothetical protein